MSKIIYLLRHPHVEKHDTLIGSKDNPLSQHGLKQAYYWKERLRNVEFTKVYTSEKQRTEITAKIIKGEDTKIIKNASFNEINLGEWEGKTKEYIIRNYSELWEKRGKDFANTTPPNGESFATLQNRVLPSLLSIVEQVEDESILIVAHQAVNRVILSHIMNISLEKILDIPQSYACLNILEGAGTVKCNAYFECPF